MRIVITGIPSTGKTTLANSQTAPVKHTDSLIGIGWKKEPLLIAEWLNEPGPWIIEGVNAVRGLREWLIHNPHGKPADEVYMLTHTWVPLKPKQVNLAKGTITVWKQIAASLHNRGVTIHLTIEKKGEQNE